MLAGRHRHSNASQYDDDKYDVDGEYGDYDDDARNSTSTPNMRDASAVRRSAIVLDTAILTQTDRQPGAKANQIFNYKRVQDINIIIKLD